MVAEGLGPQERSREWVVRNSSWSHQDRNAVRVPPHRQEGQPRRGGEGESAGRKREGESFDEGSRLSMWDTPVTILQNVSLPEALGVDPGKKTPGTISQAFMRTAHL